MKNEKRNYMDGIDSHDILNGVIIGIFVIMVLICIGSCIF